MYFVEGLETSETIQGALEQDGIEEPTAVQRVAIPAVLGGSNVLIKSGTGTGKTLAYLLPLIQRLRERAEERAVVLSPTAELAMQTLRVARAYAPEELKCGALIATGSRRQQSKSVQKSTRLIIGTPGRVLEWYRAKKLKKVTMFVVDEPDPIFTGEQTPALREVLSRPEPKIQLIMVGATIGSVAEKLLGEVSGGEPARAVVDEDPLRTLIDHRYVVLRGNQARDLLLVRLLGQHRCRRVIIFANKAATMRHLFRFLGDQGLSTVTVSSERSKGERKAAIAALSSGEARVLVTTDIAGRGLDVPDVEWVFHYELPQSNQAFLHRAGRTGRRGRRGTSVLMLTEEERFILKRFSRDLGIEFQTLEGKSKKPKARRK